MTQPLKFSLGLNIGDTDSINFLPLGNQTEIQLESNWPGVGFVGAYLPNQRQLTVTGFKVRWTVLHLGQGYSLGSGWAAN